MRAKEFIAEQSNLPDRITKPMPSTWVIPQLQNQNAYLQYIFAYIVHVEVYAIHGLAYIIPIETYSVQAIECIACNCKHKTYN
jgi:hypothetical protein